MAAVHRINIYPLEFKGQPYRKPPKPRRRRGNLCNVLACERVVYQAKASGFPHLNATWAHCALDCPGSRCISRSNLPKPELQAAPKVYRSNSTRSWHRIHVRQMEMIYNTSAYPLRTV